MYATPQESYVYNTLLQPAGVQPVWRQVQLTEAILELVRAGLGVSVLPRWVVQPYLQPLGLCGVQESVLVDSCEDGRQSCRADSHVPTTSSSSCD